MLQKLEEIESRYDDLEKDMADPEVAADYSRVQNLAKEQAAIRKLVTLSRERRRLVTEIDEVGALIRNEADEEMTAMAKEELAELEIQLDRVDRDLHVELIPKDPNDNKNVIVEIRAAAGGDEAGLFAAVLFRMYSRYAQRRDWGTEVIDANETGLGAIKEIVFQVKGNGAYSRLKHESGTHRVQRVPVTESTGRIHTSTATVAVLPEAEEVDVAVNAGDLDIDIFHASGHGGQNVQKVATAVRITHRPTGIMAICQDERSQFKNKEKAMAVLRSRILALETERAQRERADARRSQVGTGDRSERVRTYNFPQSRITDHRIGLTLHNLEQAVDGDIDAIIDGLTEYEQTQKLAAVAT
ncbi:MAG: peptide chain release factor 1 [SAR202 cluster bacterium]|nr:peptide chain release factor 1 [Chloroflexota bacterium]MDP6665084.1 peptide chain release factor 1 [SAR202 cluster bacterium]MQG58124.1 peptide chain release factor 1 [SAR202 cluster bacterium]MQG69175.1 peptide chain release factor 1 [SAR202 cluster bacterium]HAL46769.1 peptide chain release factor 1 [Dehalococcoidia bacterium]